MEEEKEYTEVGYMKVFSFNGINRAGIKKIVPINPRKTPERVNWSCKTDSRTGITYGILSGTDKKSGEPLFKKLWLEGEKSYNLAHLEEAKEFYLQMTHSPYVLGSKGIQGKPYYKVFDEEAQNEKELETFKKGKDALELVFEMPESEMVDFSRLLGITPEDNKTSTVKRLVAEKAMKSPVLFMELYDDPNRTTREVFERAIANGLINYDATAGYIHKNGHPLGITKNAAISHLMKEIALREAIDRESRIAANVNNEKPESKNDEEVRKKAKELGIKYWHTKKIDKLKKEIEVVQS